MRAECSHCGTAHNLNDAQVGRNPRVQFRCARCGKTAVIETQSPDRTQVISALPDFARAGGGPRPAVLAVADSDGLFLPAGKVIALSVLSGPAKGLVYSLQKPVTVLGRSDVDLSIDDTKISRSHCAIEVRGENVRLRDLDSTNGTFVGDERVRAAELRHLSEFRLGSCLILVTITPKLASPR